MDKIQPLFTAVATAVGGRTGHTETSDGIVKADLSLPKQMGGPAKPGTATPEHLFAAGYAACFGGALDYVAKLKKRDAAKARITCAVSIGPREGGGFGLSVKMRVEEPNIPQADLAAWTSEAHEKICLEKAAVSLAALIEAQSQKRADIETQMTREREELENEIQTNRAAWEEEKKAHQAEVKERDAAEKKLQDRAREDFNYAFKREQQAIQDKLNDEKAALEKEIKLKRETAEKEFAEREKAVSERERQLAELQVEVTFEVIGAGKV
jgi:Ohr subfamily peroxiredoxin